MKYLIIAAIVLFIVIILQVFITINITRILNKLDINNKRLDSKINDLNYNFKTPMYHIERMCDAIDQRTKAHLSKKKLDKTNEFKNNKIRSPKKKFKKIISSIDEVSNEKK